MRDFERAFKEDEDTIVALRAEVEELSTARVVDELNRARAEVERRGDTARALALALQESDHEVERLRAQLQNAREQCFTLEPDDPIRAALEEK